MPVLSSGYLELHARKYFHVPCGSQQIYVWQFSEIVKESSTCRFFFSFPWYAVGFHGQLYLLLYYNSVSPGELDNLAEETGLGGR